MAYIRTCVHNLGAIRRPVRKTCLLSLIIDVSCDGSILSRNEWATTIVTGKTNLIILIPCGHNLYETDSAKYLGLTITSDLQWNQHINNITNKANSILGILRRNLRIPSQTIKPHAFQSQVRPHLE